jgi:hypothetical protein
MGGLVASVACNLLLPALLSSAIARNNNHLWPKLQVWPCQFRQNTKIDVVFGKPLRVLAEA